MRKEFRKSRQKRNRWKGARGKGMKEAEENAKK
jgi:hypothetical protein